MMILIGGHKDHSLLLISNMTYPQNLPTVVEKYFSHIFLLSRSLESIL